MFSSTWTLLTATVLLHLVFQELAAGSPNLIVLHGALDFGHCHLGLGVPTGGRWAGVSTLEVRGQGSRVEGSGRQAFEGLPYEAVVRVLWRRRRPVAVW